MEAAETSTSTQGPKATSAVASGSRHAGPPIEVPPGMSKNAAKKLARKQKLEATKHERRAAERLKKKENKRARYLASNPDSSHKRRSSDFSEAASKKPRADDKEYFDARLVIDCGFDELMQEKESTSMTQQLMYLYSANRNAKMPFGEVILTGQDAKGDCLKDVHPDHLSLVPGESSSDTADQEGEGRTSAASIENNSIGEAMDGKLRGVWRRWKRVTIYQHGGIESLLSSADDSSASSSTPAVEASTTGRHFLPEETRQALHRIPLSSAIYLTADTDDTLTHLEPGMTYIIGGIVDKNRYKGLCRAKADRLGIRAAKLPLSQEMMEAVERNVRAQGESIQDETAGDQGEKGFVGRKVLTVNQVVEILTAWTETRDWVKALEKALPRRKLKQRGPAAKTRETSEARTSDKDEARQYAARNDP
ncbi:tRNA methyltransferase [Kalmanozyma brasiliensis GHG001]|uniref:tRNA (guanine(9)-N1)-methyltransferase n=1 Tax=Kalmanozyma brasiliensis (strain GHG001) TaxID=1365824 RepID=V5EFI5_KALBG|nr:tRNA methyltransferase [Kalmanozyma brasiliensis GHG001]EST09256.1 tRNA methyltransferase [Kalmanozyma brasiliensis GHG001]